MGNKVDLHGSISEGDLEVVVIESRTKSLHLKEQSPVSTAQDGVVTLPNCTIIAFLSLEFLSCP